MLFENVVVLGLSIFVEVEVTLAYDHGLKSINLLFAVDRAQVLGLLACFFEEFAGGKLTSEQSVVLSPVNILLASIFVDLKVMLNHSLL